MIKRQKAFTLIELLVVIAVIGLLAFIVLVTLNSARAKAHDAKVKGDVKQIITALELAHNDSPDGQYPSSGGTYKYLKPSGSCWMTFYTGDAAIAAALRPYLSEIPKPPVTNSSCFMYDSYLYTSDYTLAGFGRGAFLVWAQERPFNDCPGYYAGTQADGCNLYYCYQLLEAK